MILSRRALNRATLHRQLLLERAPLSAYDAVHHLAGLQAQVPAVPYVALWSRLAGFDPTELSDRTAERTVVRSPLMRTTIHLVTADDALAWRPLLQPVLARTFRSTVWGQGLRRAELDLDAVAAAGHALVVARPRTRAELAAALSEQFPGHDPAALAMATTYLVPLVQTTPRGLWDRSGAPTWAATEQWVGRAGAAGELDALVLRYLAAFGPATVPDVQAWCGLTRLREVTDRLGDRLRALRTDGGTVLDLPDAPRPDPDVPAPVRFLPEYDNVLLSFADRGRFVGDAGFTTVERATRRGQIGTLLVDGLVCAMWTVRRDDAAAILEVLPADRLPHAARGEIQAEAGRLLDLLAPGAEHEVRLP